MEKDLYEKLREYLANKTVSNYKIAKATGISESAMGRYVRGDKPTLANAKLIVQYFEKANSGNKILGAKQLDDFPFMNIPFIPVHAQAGYTRGYGDQEYINELPTIPVIVDKNYRGKYRVFEVEGDSMDDGSRSSLYDGDKILCREVKQELWTSKLHFKDWYFVIVCKDDGIAVKKIIDHNVETGDIVCHSLNPLFDDFTLNLRDVAELYNVIKIVDRNTRI